MKSNKIKFTHAEALAVWRSSISMKQKFDHRNDEIRREDVQLSSDRVRTSHTDTSTTIATPAAAWRKARAGRKACRKANRQTSQAR
jgi:hypothetical protein